MPKKKNFCNKYLTIIISEPCCLDIMNKISIQDDQYENTNNHMNNILSSEYLELTAKKIYEEQNKELIGQILQPIKDKMVEDSSKLYTDIMVFACGVMGGGSRIKDSKNYTELLHKGTIIIENIADNKQEPAMMINTAQLMYNLPHALIKRSALDKKTMLKMHETIAEEMIRFHLGAAMQRIINKSAQDIEENQYLEICSLKTGSIARIAARLGCLFGTPTIKQHNKMVSYAESLGIVAQIQKDVREMPDGYAAHHLDTLSKKNKKTCR